VIEPTDEMIYAFVGEPEITATDAHAIRIGLAAVLAIVERDFSLRPATCDQRHPTEDLAYCELPRGHGGSHSATVTRAIDWFARESDGR
jgi:hypothetical protein